MTAKFHRAPLSKILVSLLTLLSPLIHILKTSPELHFSIFETSLKFDLFIHLSMGDAETLIHAFVSSRLDYCNILFSGLPNSSLKSVQLVQNAAARIRTKTRKFDHITPILSSLHWLPIQARSDIKVLLLTYKTLHGLAPLYLSDLITRYSTA